MTDLLHQVDLPGLFQEGEGVPERGQVAVDFAEVAQGGSEQSNVPASFQELQRLTVVRSGLRQLSAEVATHPDVAVNVRQPLLISCGGQGFQCARKCCARSWHVAGLPEQRSVVDEDHAVHAGEVLGPAQDLLEGHLRLRSQADLGAGEVPALPARLDVLVHSAGVEQGTTVADTPRAVWEQLFATNVFAVAELTRLALPALRAARGIVVPINSGSGFHSGPGGGVYAASKFALRAFADALREEERANGLRVSSVHPGRTDSDMQRQLVAKLGESYDTDYYLAPEDVAACQAAGMAYFVSKPLTPTALIGALQHVLDETAQARSEAA